MKRKIDEKNSNVIATFDKNWAKNHLMFYDILSKAELIFFRKPPCDQKVSHIWKDELIALTEIITFSCYD